MILKGSHKRGFLTVIALIAFICLTCIAAFALAVSDSRSASAALGTDSVYLSDMNYDPAQSSVGWKEIYKDINVNGTLITLKVEGSWRAFDKGLFTHAPATVLYDISGCNYRYFTAYTGLDKFATSKSDGVKFFVYTSTDGINWTLKTSENPKVLGPSADAEFLTADVSGASYLKLVVDMIAHSGADYAAWGDAMLTNSLNPLANYDDRIKELNRTSGLENEALELLVLQRELVRKVGLSTLNRFIDASADNGIVFNWLFNDVDNLREFVMGGNPMQGSYYNALTVLSDLYKNYKTDLDNSELLNNKWKPDRTYGELYRTMMFAVALTHDGLVGSWMQKERVENQSEPLRRYAIFRFLHKDGRFIATKNQDGTAAFETASTFESLTVEEMRWIMYNIIDDESIIWLNDYVQTKINANPASVAGLHTPHSYIAYTNPNYGLPAFYAEENRDYFNELYAVDARDGSGQKIGMWDTSYTIPGGVDHPNYTLTITRGTETDKVMKMWMNFRNKFLTGCVCGGISKCGTNIRTARGIPSTVIGQPGHAAILYYTKNSQGKGYWLIDNNVGGWTVATKGERHLLGWGNETWQRTHPTVVYFHLAQDALNDYDAYVEAEENIMLARVYEDDLDKQEELYEEALSVQSINIDAWYGLIQTYIAKNKTETQLLALGNRIADAMVGYPLPMFNLLNVIKPALKTTAGVYEYTFLENKALKASSALPDSATDKTLLPSAARVEAQYLLGNVETSIAEFSFDGENAGCIVWSSRFDNTDFRWKYSLDGGNTWSQDLYFTSNAAHKYKLSAQELSEITEDNDIYVQIVGSSDKYKIDISSKPSLPNNLYANDYENAILGLNETFEWKYEDSEVWTSYASAAPDCSGQKTVQVRIKASGDNPPSDIKSFTFTPNADSETKRYVSTSNLTIEGYSSQSIDPRRPNYAANAVDGNVNTYWHTDYRENVLVSGNTPYLIIKLNSPKYVSAVEFIQYQYNPRVDVFAKNAKVYVSEDMNDWTEAGKLENLEKLGDPKLIAFGESVYAQYIKLELETYGIFATVSMVNVYEDATKIVDTDDGGGNDSGTPDGGNDSGTIDSGNNDDGKAVKIVVPIVVCAVVIAAGAVAAAIILKRKKAGKGTPKKTEKEVADKPKRATTVKEAKKETVKETKKATDKEPKKATAEKPKKETAKEPKKETGKEPKKVSHEEPKKTAGKGTSKKTK